MPARKTVILDAPEPIDAVNGASNDAEPIIDLTRPYQAEVTIKGVASLLCHKWSNESVAAKAAAQPRAG